MIKVMQTRCIGLGTARIISHSLMEKMAGVISVFLGLLFQRTRGVVLI
jgi:phosphoglycerate-specific signal transduction histidine kinase